MEKKAYTRPQMDVIRFAAEDVITTSDAVQGEMELIPVIPDPVNRPNTVDPE